MPTTDWPVRVCVYFDNQEQHDAARSALTRVDGEYDGMVIGLLSRENVRVLREKGLLFELEDNQDPSPPGSASMPISFSGTHDDYGTGDKFGPKSRLPFSRRTLLMRLREGLHDDTLPPGARAVYHVVFSEAMSGAIRAKLDTMGVRILSRDPDGGYLMFLDAEQLTAVRALPFVYETTLMEAKHRTTEAYQELIKKALQDDEVDGSLPFSFAMDEEPVAPEFDVLVHDRSDLQRVRDVIEASDDPKVEVVDSSDRIIRFRAVPGSKLLKTIEELPEVKSINPYEPPRLLCDVVRKTIGLTALSAAPPGTRWTGEGQIVAVFDSGLDINHPDLPEARVATYTTVRGAEPADRVGHGTHVAGIIAGTGAASNGRIKGVAPGAKIAMFGIVKDGRLVLPVDIAQLLDLAVKANAKIINLSWGEAFNGSYEHGSLSVDDFVHKNPDVLVVVAAGNSGRAPREFVELKSVGSPASAKNVLTVGACGTDRAEFRDRTYGEFKPQSFPTMPVSQEPWPGDPDHPLPLSSRGPTDFDSIKPEILAPGACVLSAKGKDADPRNFLEVPAELKGHYGYMSGTSMATPVVAGAAALVRQYLVDERGVSNPSAALLKALLIAAAVRIAPRTLPEKAAEKIGYPDFDQGFGRLDLSLILPHDKTPPKRKLLFAEVANASPDALQSRVPPDSERKARRTYRVTVGAEAEFLRVVLTWTDVPGAGVQNNLHLAVSGPGGVNVVGNGDHVYGRDPDLMELFGNTARPDDRNTVECVHLKHPQAGTYTLRVIAQNTPFDPQGYALIVLGDIEGELKVL